MLRITNVTFSIMAHANSPVTLSAADTNPSQTISFEEEEQHQELAQLFSRHLKDDKAPYWPRHYGLPT